MGFAIHVRIRRKRETEKKGDDWDTGDVYFRDILIQQDGYLPGYHFGKGDCISILLDGTVPLEDIYGLIDTSYQVTAWKKSRKTADKS